MTNVAIQKNAPDYDPDKGCKWSTQQLRKYLAAKHGVEAVRHSRGCTRHLSSHLIPSFEILNMDVLYIIKYNTSLLQVKNAFKGIDNIIIKSLQSVQKIIINDKHCFEMYGYDVLFDSDLKP